MAAIFTAPGTVVDAAGMHRIISMVKYTAVG